MFPIEPDPAPINEYVRYLAIFQRTFAARIDYTQKGDIEGVWLSGWLEDTLHNVPAMLWNCSHDDWYAPKKMNEWIQTFPVIVREWQVPKRLVEETERILSLENGTVELGLREDLADIDLAPFPELHDCLEMLYDGCIYMRRRRMWKDLERYRSVEEKEHIEYCRKLSTVLLPLPKGLLHWSQFDKEVFNKTGMELIGEDWASYWSKF